MKVDGWKCDRCGEYFNTLFIFPDGVQYNVRVTNPAETRTLDLCENCCNELKNWVRNSATSAAYVK